jgi:ribosomal protein S18 acetylase RimI-like enzyme
MYTVRAAIPSDCDAIAEMVRDLARDVAANKVPKVTGDSLQAYGFGEQPLLLLAVAELETRLVAAGIGAFTFSTWRGVPGLYVVDLYVKPEARNGKLGEKLLRFMAGEAWKSGARFIRLEVDRRNIGAERFYQRLGFCKNRDDTMWVQEMPAMKQLAGKG